MKENFDRDRLREEIYRLTEASLRGEAGPEELKRLEYCLNSEADALDHYLEYVSQSAALGIWATALAESAAEDRSGQTNQASSVPIAPGSDSLGADLLGQHSSHDQSSNWFFGSSGFILPLLVAATAIAVVAYLFVAPAPILNDQTVREVAQRGHDATPAASSTPPATITPAEVRSVHLDSGTTRLSLPRVGYIVIEGPAELDLLAPMRARLNSGRIKMRVTEPTGRGFVVETPYGEITDQGTEFGIDLTEKGQAGLVVFEGAVDLRVAEASALDGARVERLVGGEGVVFNRVGQLNRMSTIFTGSAATFLRQNEVAADRAPAVVAEVQMPLIVAVDDNLRSHETKKFYAIAPGGLNEDVKAYVDAPHEWNGVTADGIPEYLLGADYVRTFNQYSIQEKLGVCVTLTRPAKLYIFLDSRSTPPDWLVSEFVNTGDRIGLDANRSKRHPHRTIETGAGESIDDQFTIWVREIREPGKVRLGTNLGEMKIDPGPAMYGIAAVPLEPEHVAQ
jgi:hypothetical protein